MDNPFFDSSDQSGLLRGRCLPHWQQSGKFVFVTFRLSDSLPQSVLDIYVHEKEDWCKKHPKPWNENDSKEYYERFSMRMEKWLDAGAGNCLLSKRNNKRIVADALEFFDDERYELLSYVVMPNHVHVLVRLIGDSKLTEIVKSWKSFTARQINNAEGRTGHVWQSESFDHIIRSEQQLYKVAKYIYDNNPKSAYVKHFDWLEN